jgi:ABC-2 type transport system permease protein
MSNDTQLAERVTREAGTAPPRASGSFWSAVSLVAQREIRQQVRTRGFWIGFGVFVVGLFAISVLPGIIGGDSAPAVATVGPEAAQAVAATELDGRPVDDIEEARALVRSGEVAAAVVDADNGVRVIALTHEPTDVLAELSSPPPVELLEPDVVDDRVLYLAAFVFGLVFVIFAMSGIGIAQSVVIEKQTRIVEILAATVPVRALLTGKIAAFSLLVFGQVAGLAALAPIALRAGDQGVLLRLIAPAIGWFVPFFLLGFVLLAAMWAVAGALVSRMEDLSSTSSIIMLLVMAPYFGVAFFLDDDTVLTVLSYVPFSAAVAMPVRMFAGEVQVWEPLLSMGILAVSLVVCVLVASRLYSGSLLQTGTRVRLRGAWRGAQS